MLDKPKAKSMGNSCSPGCRWWCLWWRLFVLSLFPLDVLDVILDLIASVSEGFLTYSYVNIYGSVDESWQYLPSLFM